MLKIRLNFGKVIAIAICLTGSMTIFAQDIIYRNNGVDVQAVVLLVGTDYVHYKRFDNQNGPTYRLRTSEISMIRYEDGSRDVFDGVSPSIEGRQQAPVNQRNYNRNNYGYSRQSRQQYPPPRNIYDSQDEISTNTFRFAVDAGFSYRIAKAYSELDGLARDFFNKTRAGFVYGGDIHGFFPIGLGIGAKFTGHHYTRTEMGLKYQVNTYYLAPSFMWRTFTQNLDVFYYGFSVGYVHFNEKLSYASDMQLFDKGGIGTTFDLGYDIRLKGKTFAGFKLTFTTGNIFLDIKDSSGNDLVESLAAIDLSVGFRF